MTLTLTLENGPVGFLWNECVRGRLRFLEHQLIHTILPCKGQTFRSTMRNFAGWPTKYLGTVVKSQL